MEAPGEIKFAPVVVDKRIQTAYTTVISNHILTTGSPVHRAERRTEVLDPQNLIRIMPAEGEEIKVKTSPSQAEGFFVQVSRVVIMANGDLPNLASARKILRPDDYFIAADGGLRYFRAMEILPHLIIGDLDSIAAEELPGLQSAGVEIRRFPVEKNETDLELALRAAADISTTIIVMAGLGGRLDQTLGNIYLLLDPRLADKNIRLEDGVEEVFWIRTEAVITGEPGDRVSLLPLLGTVQGVLTTDLRYPLNTETLFPEHSRGISNEMTAHTARVSIASGCLLCIHTRQSGGSHSSSIIETI